MVEPAVVDEFAAGRKLAGAIKRGSICVVGCGQAWLLLVHGIRMGSRAPSWDIRASAPDRAGADVFEPCPAGLLLVGLGGDIYAAGRDVVWIEHGLCHRRRRQGHRELREILPVCIESPRKPHASASIRRQRAIIVSVAI